MEKGIYFFVGTTAELIKVFPIMQELNKQGVAYKIIASGQNKLDVDILEKTGIEPISIQLSDKGINQSVFGLLSWFVTTLVKSLFRLKSFFQKDCKNSYLLVHGDTISTVMGAVIGKLYRLKVVHIEAGLRSFNYFKPFPEEIDRMIVSKLTDIHCCPNEWSLKNVENKKGLKINTVQNTLLDGLNYALNVNVNSALYDKLKDKDFFIFVYHRQENLFNEERMRHIFKKIVNYSRENMTCLLVLHDPTKEALLKADLLEKIKKEKSIVTSKRFNYFEFMKLLNAAKFIVTDGGSNQEESYYFGKPCLILRNETERNEGLGENAILSKFDDGIIDYFLSSHETYQRGFVEVDVTPSRKIVNALLSK
jgi:UDP-N-acetylglucosamine 2-epimerase (non-hydrolysing)